MIQGANRCFGGWLLSALLVLGALVPCAQADEYPIRRGEAIAGVIDRFRNDGLPVIYTSRLVPRSMLVMNVPDASEPVATIAALLRPYGLQLSQRGSFYVVVRLDSPAENDDAPVPVSDAPPAIDEVVVSASRYVLDRQSSNPGTNAGSDDILALPDLGDDPIRFIQRLPGTASNGVTARTHMRGGLQDEVGIVLNGYRLRDPYHVRDLQSPFSVIDTRAVGSMQVYSGGFSARYGERMSGLVVIDSLQPESPLQHEIGFSAYNTSLLSSAYFDGTRGQWLASVRRSNLDLVVDDSFGDPSFRDAFVAASYDISPMASIGINMLLADDSVDVFLENDGIDLERSRDDASSRQLWLTHEQRIQDHWQITSVLGYENAKRLRSADNIQLDKVTAGVNDRRRISAWSLRQDAQWSRSERQQIEFGYSYERIRSDYDYAVAAEYFDEWLIYETVQNPQISRATVASISGEALSAYLALSQQMTPRLTGEFGLRWDKQTYTDGGADSGLSPRIGLLYGLPDEWQLRASYGRYQQAQRLDELDVSDGDTTFYPAQTTDQYVVGAQKSLSDALTLRIEAYSKRIRRVKPRYENLLDPLIIIPEVAPDRIRIAPGSARAEGIELLLEHQSQSLDWWLSFSWSKVQDRIDQRWVDRSWDQRRAVSAGTVLRRGPWELSAALLWRSGWPTTPLFLTNPNPDSPELGFGLLNSDRLSDFTSLNLRAARGIDVTIGELDVFVELTNALNQENVCCRDYDLDELDNGMLALTSSDELWLSLLPAAGVLWRF